MSYKVNKTSIFKYENNPSSQSVSTTYIEPTGSRVHLKFSGNSAKIYYEYSFYAYQASSSPIFLHIKLQKSNDNFASDIEDVSGANFNFSGDTEESPPDDQYQSITPMFVIDSCDKRYLRILVRSYSTTTAATLHRSTQWDGSTSADVYYNPSCIALEV